MEGKPIDFIDVGILPTLLHQFTQQLAACFSWFLLHLFFYPENGDMFHRNVGLSPNYAALQAKRQ
jgi:hypothetical protein